MEFAASPPASPHATMHGRNMMEDETQYIGAELFEALLYSDAPTSGPNLAQSYQAHEIVDEGGEEVLHAEAIAESPAASESSTSSKSTVGIRHSGSSSADTDIRTDRHVWSPGDQEDTSTEDRPAQEDPFDHEQVQRSASAATEPDVIADAAGHGNNAGITNNAADEVEALPDTASLIHTNRHVYVRTGSDSWAPGGHKQTASEKVPDANEHGQVPRFAPAADSSAELHRKSADSTVPTESVSSPSGTDDTAQATCTNVGPESADRAEVHGVPADASACNQQPSSRLQVAQPDVLNDACNPDPPDPQGGEGSASDRISTATDVS